MPRRGRSVGRESFKGPRDWYNSTDVGLKQPRHWSKEKQILAAPSGDSSDINTRDLGRIEKKDKIGDRLYKL